MKPERATSLVLATLLLIVLGVAVAIILTMWDTASSSQSPENTMFTNKLVLESVRLVKPITVENAKWQIELIINNNGNADAIVDKVYINNKLVTETGISQGGALSSKSSIGTDLPVDGLVVPKGKSVTINVWLGQDLYNLGTSILVEAQRQDVFELKKYIVLN